MICLGANETRDSSSSDNLRKSTSYQSAPHPLKNPPAGIIQLLTPSPDAFTFSGKAQQRHKSSCCTGKSHTHRSTQFIIIINTMDKKKQITGHLKKICIMLVKDQDEQTQLLILKETILIQGERDFSKFQLKDLTEIINSILLTKA